MSYTITREYAPGAAHSVGFMGIDYDLHYTDEIELVVRFADSLEYANTYGSDETPNDMTYQILDEWLTTSRAGIAEMWLRNNCPEPEIDSHDPSNNTIVEQMTRALYDLGSNFLNGLIGPFDRADAALQRINLIYPIAK
jgi:hypothetical protein